MQLKHFEMHHHFFFSLLPSSSPLLSSESYAAYQCISRILISSAQIVPAASLGKKIATELQKCLSDIYVLVSQPGVNAADYQSGFSTPHLSQKVLGHDHKIRSSLTVTDVLGQLEVENFSDVIQKACGAELVNVDASSTLLQSNPL